jgi:hypothetical protein
MNAEPHKAQGSRSRRAIAIVSSALILMFGIPLLWPTTISREMERELTNITESAESATLIVFAEPTGEGVIQSVILSQDELITVREMFRSGRVFLGGGFNEIMCREMKYGIRFEGKGDNTRDVLLDFCGNHFTVRGFSTEQLPSHWISGLKSLFVRYDIIVRSD